jgi:hypothetical protein
LELSVPLSRFTSRVGGGSAFYVQERQTGNIIRYDRQEVTATDTGASLAASAAGIKAVDELTE